MAKVSEAESVEVTVTSTVKVDPEWIDFVCGSTAPDTDIFMQAYCGYWAYGCEYARGRGWLVYVDLHGEGSRPGFHYEEAADQAWRKGRALPENFYAFDRDLAIRAWVEGVKRGGERWYEEGDATTYDVAIQVALFREVRFG